MSLARVKGNPHATSLVLFAFVSISVVCSSWLAGDVQKLYFGEVYDSKHYGLKLKLGIADHASELNYDAAEKTSTA